jgi:hypothetical protein
MCVLQRRGCAIEAKRRAKKLQCTPKWLTEDHFNQIGMIYCMSDMMTKSTGVPHHVDHIIPLQGKTVNGLHVPWNLQVIPAVDNFKKSNKYGRREAASQIIQVLEKGGVRV